MDPFYSIPLQPVKKVPYRMIRIIARDLQNSPLKIFFVVDHVSAVDEISQVGHIIIPDRVLLCVPVEAFYHLPPVEHVELDPAGQIRSPANHTDIVCK